MKKRKRRMRKMEKTKKRRMRKKRMTHQRKMTLYTTITMKL